jgi:alanine racemase
MTARARITVSGSALRNNYRILSSKVASLSLIPMVKADAYGHGAIEAARTLLKEKKLHGFGVATFREALELRLALKGSRIPVIVFSDSAPWTPEHTGLCLRYRLEPVLSEIESLLAFQSLPAASKIPFHVEVNSGMNRLGIPPESMRLIRLKPASVFTHLAEAERPYSPPTRAQMAGFATVVDEVRARFPDTLLHFANSAAIWNARSYPLMKEMDLARPGLSLYGIRPMEKARDEGLRRVMRYTSRILNRIHLEAGDRVGYGGTYVCRKKGGEWVGVIGAGYADGVFRSLSNAGIAVHGKKKLPFIGRVSMDLSALRIPPGARVGDEVVLWGDEIDPYDQAGRAGTIPYEITTRVGARVERVYE